MRNRDLQPRIAVLALMFLAALPPRDANGQRATLSGYVRDSAGVGVVEADVGIPTLKRLTKTDEQGRFSFERLQRGSVEISVRRLGFEPYYVSTEIGAQTDTIFIVLKRQPLRLAVYDVTAKEMRRREAIEEFYRRRVTGVGQYVTRDQVEDRWGGKASDLLRNTPGLRLVTVAAGKGVRFPTTSINRRNCAPMIWVDGQKAPGMEIDDIPLMDVEGIELYNGPSTTPLQFSPSSSDNTCGTVVIWSRPPPAARKP